MKTKNNLSIQLRLSAQRALLGHVPCCLRLVYIELKDSIIHWKCVFDKTATEDDIELLSSAAAEVIADYSDYGLNEIFEKVSKGEATSTLEHLVYYRHEHNYYQE